MLISASLATFAQIVSSASVPRLRDAFAPLQDQPEIYLISLLRILAKHGSAADIPAIVLVLNCQKPRSSEAALETLGKIIKRMEPKELIRRPCFRACSGPRASFRAGLAVSSVP